MELEIQHTSVFSKIYKSYEDGFRFVLCQGGSRSSKTYSILQLLIVICLTTPGIKVSVVRKSFPSLRGSVLRDFIEILNQYNLYDIKRHNRTENIYKFINGSTIEFFSIDDSQKVRGRKRDICYLNEGNELTQEDFIQLSLRTTKTLFIDFNPSDSEHFLYDLINDERTCLIKSTYKDNNFLSEDIVKEIENLINVDVNYYRIYALGEAPTMTTRVYNHFKQYTDEPNDIIDTCYGLDFGFNHKTALVKTMYGKDGKIYLKELIYKSGMVISDLISECKLLVENGRPIYCDSARPEIIKELVSNGLNAVKSNKNVKEGIDTVKSSEIYVHYESINILNEYRLYSWKSVGDKILDEVIKISDDICDAIRYSIHTHKKKQFNANAFKLYF